LDREQAKRLCAVPFFDPPGSGRHGKDIYFGAGKAGKSSGGQITPNYAAAKFAKDARRKARRRTFVLQVPDNKADLVKLAAPCGFKYRTIFNSGGMHLLGEHSKLDNTP